MCLFHTVQIYTIVAISVKLLRVGMFTYGPAENMLDMIGTVVIYSALVSLPV